MVGGTVGSAQRGLLGQVHCRHLQKQPGLMLMVLLGIWEPANFGCSCLHHAAQELKT